MADANSQVTANPEAEPPLIVEARATAARVAGALRVLGLLLRSIERAGPDDMERIKGEAAAYARSLDSRT